MNAENSVYNVFPLFIRRTTKMSDNVHASGYILPILCDTDGYLLSNSLVNGINKQDLSLK